MSYDPHPYNDPYASPKAGSYYGEPAQRYAQSGLGIASFIMGIVLGLSAFALVVMAGVLEASTPGGMDENSPITMLIGLGILAVLGMSLIGIGLGIAGACQSRRSKIFAWLGIACNAMVLLGFCVLMGIGLNFRA